MIMQIRAYVFQMWLYAIWMWYLSAAKPATLVKIPESKYRTYYLDVCVRSFPNVNWMHKVLHNGHIVSDFKTFTVK